MHIFKGEHIATQFNKGGGAGDLPPAQQAAPPRQVSNVSNVQARSDLIRRNAKRRGFAASRVAGETGAVGGQTVLSALGG